MLIEKIKKYFEDIKNFFFAVYNEALNLKRPSFIETVQYFYAILFFALMSGLVFVVVDYFSISFIHLFFSFF